MPQLIEGKLIFECPDDWWATPYDQWAFYRNQFQSVCDGSKGVDILALSPGFKETWLIEVKDYRTDRRTKPIDLANEVAFKVRDTLAGLVAAAVNANDSEEKSFARQSVQSSRLRVALHLEQPEKHSRLFPRAINPANVRQKLKGLLKAIDPHPRVLDRTMARTSLAWKIT